MDIDWKIGSTTRSQKSFFLFLVVLALFLVPGETAAAEDLYGPIKERMVQDGFSPRLAARLFQPPPAPLFKVVAQTFRLRESKLNYDQFLAPPAIQKARRFMLEHSTALAAAEETYGVDRCVIVGILLVETHFGSYTGKTPTLGIFATFALMSSEKYRDKIWTLLTPEDRKRWGREAFDAKLKQRADWAYGELCALLKLMEMHSARVETYRGSVMGAVGWPQFLPSSLVRYGADGNRDGRIDLYQPDDAIYSVANYLRGYGWCNARTQAEKEDVIHHYNKSRPYVNAVLGVAQKLKEKG